MVIKARSARMAAGRRHICEIETNTHVAWKGPFVKTARTRTSGYWKGVWISSSPTIHLMLQMTKADPHVFEQWHHPAKTLVAFWSSLRVTRTFSGNTVRLALRVSITLSLVVNTI